MKRCSQCGAEVPDTARVGDRCPRCKLTWQAERKDTYSYKRPKEKSGCGWWIAVLIIFMAISVGLPKLIRSKSIIIENRIITQWLSLNVDSVIVSKDLIMGLKSPQRDSVFKHVSVKYASAINEAGSQSRMNMMAFTTQIDSVFSDSLLNFRILNDNAIYRKLNEIYTNPDLLETIRKKADSTLQILHTR